MTEMQVQPKGLPEAKKKVPLPNGSGTSILMDYHHSTVTDLAKFLGWSTLRPRITATS